MRKKTNRVPRWLVRLSQVKAELKGVQFPRSAEEGLKECATLSATSLRFLEDQIIASRTRTDTRQVDAEMRRLIARLTQADANRIPVWRKESARLFQR